MIRVFSRRTKWTPDDDLAFIGDPPIIGKPDPALPVYVSCSFTWDMMECERLARSWTSAGYHVELGGPAFRSPAGEFTPGQFIKKGVPFTSRGCPKQCSWCMVPDWEGPLKELGLYTVRIHLHQEIDAELKVWVVPTVADAA